MLKNIQFHIEQNNETQLSLEESVSKGIQSRLNENLNALQRYIPTLYNQVKAVNNSSKSIVCNKHGLLNIIDYQSGRVFYDEHPEREVNAQLEAYWSAPLRIETHNSDKSVSDSSVLVILGLGLGYHLEPMIRRSNAKHILIYEPEFSYFCSSLSAISWRDILSDAHKDKRALYLLTEKDGRGLFKDLTELAQHEDFSSFTVFKHYNHPVFDQLIYALQNRSWSEMGSWLVDSESLNSTTRYINSWPTHSIGKWTDEHLDTERFNSNIEAFKRYFPDIGEEFENYKPVSWFPKANDNGEVNVFLSPLESPFYSTSPIEEEKKVFGAFSRRPNKDGLIMGYTGKKLRKYLHYQMVLEMSPILDGISEQNGVLPSEIRSVIMFGLGVGYGLEQLCLEHDVEMLFVCEPNRDFFYASLFAIDWAEIITKQDKSGGRIYLNIGDDGSNLISDLLEQFHSIGPYVLASTYFYQGYYNANLVNAIGQLREQLKVIIAMGDYFDHAKYGIAHTKSTFQKRLPFMRGDSHQCLSLYQKELPVFVVGNGPSLDALIETINEHKHAAIIISCGTALQSLHRHGIQPDFHAEIESNRSTFDWAVRVGCLEFLKKITLISCNGIHPDTCGLYKDVLLAFKEGESATVSFTEALEDRTYKKLSFAYPTVTNFAFDFFTQVGFQQVYLFGVDFGFVDPHYHHSRKSGYYTENAEERYDYREENDTSIVIEGNFRKFVNTKYEFKVAKRVFEQSIPGGIDVYNVSDGAKIYGTKTLLPDNVFVAANALEKAEVISAFKERCFKVVSPEVFEDKFSSRFSSEHLVQELTSLMSVVNHPVTKRADVEHLITEQRELLVLSYKRKKSLLFFYLNGTLNYVNSALTRALLVVDDEQVIAVVKDLMVIWREKLSQMIRLLEYQEFSYDFISSFEMERRRLYMGLSTKVSIPKHGAIFPTTQRYQAYFSDALTKLGLENEFETSPEAPDYELCFKEMSTSATSRKILISDDNSVLQKYIKGEGLHSLLYLPGSMFDGDSPVCNNVIRCFIARLVVNSDISSSIVLPKVIVASTHDVRKYYNLEMFKDLNAYDCSNFLLFSSRILSNDSCFLEDGTRARYISRDICEEDLVAIQASEDELEEMREFRIQLFNSLAVHK